MRRRARSPSPPTNGKPSRTGTNRTSTSAAFCATIPRRRATLYGPPDATALVCRGSEAAVLKQAPFLRREGEPPTASRRGTVAAPAQPVLRRAHNAIAGRSAQAIHDGRTETDGSDAFDIDDIHPLRIQPSQTAIHIVRYHFVIVPASRDAHRVGRTAE